MYFNVIIITLVIFLVITSIFKFFEILKDVNTRNQNFNVLTNKLSDQIQLQSSLKHRVILLDRLNVFMFKQVSFILKELMDVQKSLLSNNF